MYEVMRAVGMFILFSVHTHMSLPARISVTFNALFTISHLMDIIANRLFTALQTSGLVVEYQDSSLTLPFRNLSPLQRNALYA
jgi:hypothetical protein